MTRTAGRLSRSPAAGGAPGRRLPAHGGQGEKGEREAGRGGESRVEERQREREESQGGEVQQPGRPAGLTGWGLCSCSERPRRSNQCRKTKTQKRLRKDSDQNQKKLGRDSGKTQGSDPPISLSLRPAPPPTDSRRLGNAHGARAPSDVEGFLGCQFQPPSSPPGPSRAASRFALLWEPPCTIRPWLAGVTCPPLPPHLRGPLYVREDSLLFRAST